MNGHTMNKGPARIATRLLAAFALAAGCATGALAQDAGAKYAKLLADTASYESYNSLIARQLDSQTRELASIEVQFAQLDATGADVVALVAKMFEKLDAFVAQDLPFLDPISDRKERVERLRNMISDEGVPLAEKYRRLLEAYQIEMDYGRNLAAYPGKMDDGRDAEFVRIGRIVLMYRISDGTEVGYWDKAGGKWVVDKDYSEAVLTAIRVAKKEVAPDVIQVPVPAAQEVGS